MQLKVREMALAPRAKAWGVLAAGAALMSLSMGTLAQNAPAVSVGAGVRTGFTSLDIDGLDEDINDFELNNARIYIGGQATEDISLMFNTEYSSVDEKVMVIDAVAKFEFAKELNIWAGRFLPPSDRANMYGPFYANNFQPFIDGVQANYPSETTGRQDGVMYWGQIGIAKISAGVFDAPQTKGDSDVLYAARAQLDFWDAEDGYYLNGTYYGEKDLLALGVATQTASGDNAYTVDFLLEKKLANLGVISVEAEYAKYDGLGGAPVNISIAGIPVGANESDGFYALGAYLFPQKIGIGQLQVLLKAGEATFEFPIIGDVDQETTEFNLNYIIKDFKARIGIFYVDVNFKPGSSGVIGVPSDAKLAGILFQVQI
jgi:hypothetical protein